MARTTSTPECCDSTIWRPASVPTMALSEASSSFQKSASVAVVTWLPSVMVDCVPVEVEPVAPPVVLFVTFDTEPEITRVSLDPVRRPLG